MIVSSTTFFGGSSSTTLADCWSERRGRIDQSRLCDSKRFRTLECGRRSDAGLSERCVAELVKRNQRSDAKYFPPRPPFLLERPRDCLTHLAAALAQPLCQLGAR